MRAENLVLVFVLLTPLASFAGQGWVISVTNYNKATGSSTVAGATASYPQISAHVTNGATCWKDGELGSWDKVAMPDRGSASWYTEEESSFVNTCRNSGDTVVRLRDFALYIKNDESSGWKMISSPMRLSYYSENEGRCVSPDTCISIPVYEYREVDEVNTSGEYVRQLSRIGTGPDFMLPVDCGLIINGELKMVGDKPSVSFRVSGPLDQSCLNGVSSLSRTAHAMVAVENPPLPIVNIAMKPGAVKLVKLPQVSENTSWELEQCTGNVVTTDGVLPRKFNVALPNQIRIRAVNKGTEECTVNAWSYSSDNASRSLVAGRRYVINVR